VEDWVALSEIVRNVGIVIGGVLGIYLAWKRVTAANRQAEAQTRLAELQRRVSVDELFNRAVGQLKHEKLEVRLGCHFHATSDMRRLFRSVSPDFGDIGCLRS